MTGTATVALTELIPARADRRALLVATAANMGGLGLGPLSPDCSPVRRPSHHLGVRGVPGSAGRRGPGPAADPRNGEPTPAAHPALRRPRRPDPGRGEFLAAATAGFSAFSLLGLFAALAPTVLGSVMHQHSHAVQGRKCRPRFISFLWS